jgi:hypothetical protein
MIGGIYQSAKFLIVWLGRERRDAHDSSAEDFDGRRERIEVDESTLDDPLRHLSPLTLKTASTD